MDIKFYFSCLTLCLSFVAFDAQAYQFSSISKWAFIFNCLIGGVVGAHSGDEESDEESPSQRVPLETLETLMKSAAVKSLETLLVEMKNNKKVGDEKYIVALGTLLDKKAPDPLDGILKKVAKYMHTNAKSKKTMDRYYWFMKDKGMLLIWLSVGEDKSVRCSGHGAATDHTEAEKQDESKYRIKFEFCDPEKMKIRFL